MRSDWEFTYDRESVRQFGSQWAHQDSPLPGLVPYPGDDHRYLLLDWNSNSENWRVHHRRARSGRWDYRWHPPQTDAMYSASERPGSGTRVQGRPLMPATVVMIPDRLTRRTRSLSVSAM